MNIVVTKMEGSAIKIKIRLDILSILWYSLPVGGKGVENSFSQIVSFIYRRQTQGDSTISQERPCNDNLFIRKTNEKLN
jgi:hypothetical protein